jgi:hypothetical protein
MANKVGVAAMLVGILLALGPLPLGGALIMVTGSIGLAIAWEGGAGGQLLGEGKREGEVPVPVGPEVRRFQSR